MTMDRQPLAAPKRGVPSSVIAIALAALFVAALGPVALAAQPDEVPGNNGTVKIHEGAGEPAAEVRNEPHVCTFHLHFFFADAGDSGTWEIQEWAPGDKGTVVLEGTYTTDENGEDRDPDAGVYELPDGHYKLFWDGDLDTNKHDKHKVFWVDCEDEGGPGPVEATPTPTPPGGGGPTEGTPTPTPPGGGGPTEGTPTPTPPGGGVGPVEGTPTPTPPGGGVAPTQGTPPPGAVAGATGTPVPTLPPTDAADQSTSGSAGLWAALLLLIAVGTTVALATVPVSSVRNRSRRR
jgi:hypothetical protein